MEDQVKSGRVAASPAGVRFSLLLLPLLLQVSPDLRKIRPFKLLHGLCFNYSGNNPRASAVYRKRNNELFRISADDCSRTTLFAFLLRLTIPSGSSQFLLEFIFRKIDASARGFISDN